MTGQEVIILWAAAATVALIFCSGLLWGTWRDASFHAKRAENFELDKQMFQGELKEVRRIVTEVLHKDIWPAAEGVRLVATMLEIAQQRMSDALDDPTVSLGELAGNLGREPVGFVFVSDHAIQRATERLDVKRSNARSVVVNAFRRSVCVKRERLTTAWLGVVGKQVVFFLARTNDERPGWVVTTVLGVQEAIHNQMVFGSRGGRGKEKFSSVKPVEMK